jgi:phosphoglycolate phosphatase
MRLKLVIFDLDGTLADAYPAIYRSFNYAMRTHGYPAQKQAVIRRAVGWGDANLLAPFVRGEDLQAAVSAYRRHHRRALAGGSRFLPGAKKALAQLKRRRLRLAIASNRPTAFSRILLRVLKIEKYFDYLLCADKLRQGKPHPEILRRILRHFRVKPPEAVFVGDMAIDARAGRRAGIRTVIVTTGSSSLREIKKERPWKILPSLSGLTEAILPAARS